MFTTSLGICNTIWKNRELIKQLTKREVISRYRGSYLGVLWSILTPLAMLVIFTFVFSVIFQARWGGGSGSKVEFALIIFCGLATFNVFAECILRSPSLILSQPNYVKKVVFPLEIFPVVALGSALVQWLISIVILLISLFVLFGSLHSTIFYLPIVMLPLLLICLGLSWFLASLGVFLRDINHIIGLIVQALMFLSPIFYPVSVVPKELRFIYHLNPISFVVEDMRRIVIWGQPPNWDWLIIGSIVGFVVAFLGFAWFQKTRGGFADVI